MYSVYSLYAGLPIIWKIVALVLIGVCAAAWCGIFHKAGIPWFRVFIPAYNIYNRHVVANCTVLFWGCLAISDRLMIIQSLTVPAGSRSILFPILLFFTFLVVRIVFCMQLSEAFGKGNAFTAGLFFFPPVFLMILAYGSAEHYTTRNVEIRDSSWTCPHCGTVNPISRVACSECRAYR